MTGNPLVSVVTPVLNGGSYLRECVDSVLRQGYPLIEHVFVDGGSTDGTADVLANYSAKYPQRIRFVSAPGTGAGEAQNIGLNMAKGDIFGVLGADDICEPGAINAVVDFFRSHPEACFVHGHCDFINENGEVIGQHRVNGFNFQDYANTAKHIAAPSAFCTRAVMEKIGRIDTGGHDFDVMLRIARQFQIYQIETVLSKVRLRQNSTFNPFDFQKRKEKFQTVYRISRKYGGSAFSPIARDYYCALIFGWLHLGPLFMPIRSLLHKLRRLPGP